MTTAKRTFVPVEGPVSFAISVGDGKMKTVDVPKAGLKTDDQLVILALVNHPDVTEKTEGAKE